MKTPKKLKKHLLVMLFFSIVFLLSGFLISALIKNYYSSPKVTTRLISEVNSALADLDAEIQNVISVNLEDETKIRNFLDQNYKNAFSEKGIELLIYKNDTLSYWTDNVFAAPYTRDIKSFTSDILKSGSGYYLVRIKEIDKLSIVALQLLKSEYNYTNDYLPSSFYKRFSAPDNAGISFQPGQYSILDKDGKFLFSLTFDTPFELQIWLQYLIFTLYLSSFLCLIASTFIAYMFLMRNMGNKWLMFLVFIIDVIILRAIQFYFRFPADLYQIQLFNPAYFASSEVLPSLGDFLINALLALQLSYFAFKQSDSWFRGTTKKPFYGKLSSIISFILIIILFHFLVASISGLILNSSISFRFENILSLPHLSHIGIIIIALLLTTFFFFFEIAGKLLVYSAQNKSFYIVVSAISSIAYVVITWVLEVFDLFHIVLLTAILGLLIVHVCFQSLIKIRLGRITILVFFLSALATYLVNKAETEREHDKRILMATRLADARDNLAEYYFNKSAESIKNDTLISHFLSATVHDSVYNRLAFHIKERYFSGYWDKYNIQITICSPDKELIIKPGNVIQGCDDYFNEKINRFMRPVSVQGLYFLKQSVDATYYLGKIVLPGITSDTKANSIVFIEISSNDVRRGLGYPELLIDKKNESIDNLYGYSYAFYYKGELVKNVGRYSYDIEKDTIGRDKNNSGFYNQKGYSHLLFKVNRDTEIVISKETPFSSDLIAPFSYIFLLFVIILFITNWMRGSSLGWKMGLHTFRLRLQVIMISVIVVSSIILVTVSLLFINNLNRNKNNEILNEKLNSVLVDLEYRYSSIASFDEINMEELSDLLLTLSNTYFTDINIYNTNGFLLASSRDQIFREGMVSEQLNPASASQLMLEKKSFLIQRESIGTYSFLSAYTPVRNIDNQLLGYLNLPYFARQEEIRHEISGLISAFANIYILMIVVTVILALLLSRYITMPLQHIGNQFSMVKIGDKNDKIEWRRKDEIGRLVDEYNRMIDEMEKSAELLARSERESAWRQMARQVAHEIKNPLTPIKLSMQLLMRAWNDQVPDWDTRLKRFSQTLIMQIDTLSSIATEFSDFAQMPEPQIQQFDVIPLIQQSAALFRDQSDCDISFETSFTECIIKADPNQILRVFNNLIKNALQAIPSDRQGKIAIGLNVIENKCEINFRDNGTGIPNEKQTRIFSPNFTTKTAGMGLGLAMVKNIIDSTSGRIWFETDPGIGTTFFVSLPLQDNELSI